MSRNASHDWADLTAGHALRHGILNKITPILLSSNFVGDLRTRLTIKESCLDVVSLLEELIKQYGLDTHTVQPK